MCISLCVRRCVHTCVCVIVSVLTSVLLQTVGIFTSTFSSADVDVFALGVVPLLLESCPENSFCLFAAPNEGQSSFVYDLHLLHNVFNGSLRQVHSDGDPLRALLWTEETVWLPIFRGFLQWEAMACNSVSSRSKDVY